MQYVHLGEREKHNRRSVADAIELLVTDTGFRHKNHATIRTVPFPFPAKWPLTQLCVVFEHFDRQQTFLVWLPTSSHIKARTAESRNSAKSDTVILDGAQVDIDASVWLSNGTQLRAVEVVPANLPYELSNLDWQIIESTIKLMKIGHLVMRTFGEELDDDVRETLPQIRRVDFLRLKEHQPPPLKVIQHFIETEGVGHISFEKLSSTLSKCGMRLVRRRASHRQLG